VLARSELSPSASDLYSTLKLRARANASFSSTERVVEVAGRTCYLSFANASGKSTADYIENLVGKVTKAFLEHASWTFILVGVSRAFNSSKWLRHRRRFCLQPIVAAIRRSPCDSLCIPSELLANPELLPSWKKTVIAQREAYVGLVESLQSTQSHLGSERVRSMPRAARSVCQIGRRGYHRYYRTRGAWRHFLEIRGSTEGTLRCDVYVLYSSQL